MLARQPLPSREPRPRPSRAARLPAVPSGSADRRRPVKAGSPRSAAAALRYGRSGQGRPGGDHGAPRAPRRRRARPWRARAAAQRPAVRRTWTAPGSGGPGRQRGRRGRGRLDRRRASVLSALRKGSPVDAPAPGTRRWRKAAAWRPGARTRGRGPAPSRGDATRRADLGSQGPLAFSGASGRASAAGADPGAGSASTCAGRVLGHRNGSARNGFGAPRASRRPRRRAVARAPIRSSGAPGRRSASGSRPRPWPSTPR
jgi:hypothetical protein